MSQHNIIGHERSGPHVVVRRIKRASRRTFGHLVLEAVGGVTLLSIFTIAACRAFGA